MVRGLGVALVVGTVILTPGCREPGPTGAAQAPGRSTPRELAAQPEPAAQPQPADARAPTPAKASRPADAQALGEALERGIPAMTYRARPPRNAQGEPQIPYEAFRLGLLVPAEDPDAARFVPVTPVVPSALGGLLDREAGRALVLAGDLVLGDIWLVQARRLDVSLFDLREAGRVVLHADDVDARLPETDEIRVAVEAALASDDEVRVTLRDLRYDPKGTASVLVTKDGVRLTREHVTLADRRVHVDSHAAWVGVPPPPGVTLEGNRLRVGDPPARDLPSRGQTRTEPTTLALARGHEPGHQHLARTPDGRFVMVFSEQAGCRELAFVRHVLDRVDLRTGTATRLSDAPVHAGAALGPDGSVYLDAHGRVVRFPPDSATAVADVPPGVRFATPDFDRDCSI